MPATTHGCAENRGLIEAAPSQALGMERHRNDQIGFAEASLAGSSHQLTEHFPIRQFTPVLETMNRPADRMGWSTVPWIAHPAAGAQKGRRTEKTLSAQVTLNPEMRIRLPAQQTVRWFH